MEKKFETSIQYELYGWSNAERKWLFVGKLDRIPNKPSLFQKTLGKYSNFRLVQVNRKEISL